MNHPRETRTASTRETTTPVTPAKRVWTRPDFVEIAVCAEICAYVHRA